MKIDKGLPYLQKIDNIARYENGKIIIHDRRSYPAKIEHITCEDYHEVAQAIKDMVTQSYGPWVISLIAMINAARKAKDLKKTKAQEVLKEAAHVLSNARPTTSHGMAYEITKVLNFSLHALEEGGDVEQQTHDFVYKAIETRYKEDRAMGEYTVSLLPDPAIIMTQCYAETLIGYVLSVSLEMGKKIELICPETRPYLQGARLTASDAYDLGVPVTVITDNMPGYMLSLGKVDAFVCAADVITVDGHIVNKIGTLQIALAADHFGVPFYATRNPSVWNPTIDTVEIEERNPEEVLHAMGMRTAKPGVNGYYPAFDITPPSLVSAVVTSKGIFSPYNLGQHFKAA